MSDQPTNRRRFCYVALVVLAEMAHLAWEYFHGGVRTHHFLARADMPSISNWWGLLLLPVLTWFVTGRIQRRIVRGSLGHPTETKLPASVMVGFVGALLFGVVLSLAAMSGNATIAEYLFLGMLLLALLLPVYRAECVLGFALGMTVAVGAVLPTIIGSVIAAFSALIHLLVRPLLVRLWRRFK